jgi:hypothetical protein
MKTTARARNGDAVVSGMPLLLGSIILLLFAVMACEETIAGPVLPEGDLSVTIEPEMAVVEVGETVRFTGSVNHQGFVLTWRSGDPTIAIIDSAGIAQGVARGETYVHLFVALAPHVRDSARILVQ